MWDLLVDSEIPLEICLTSNVKCKTAKSYKDHHVKHLLAANHPFAICTDVRVNNIIYILGTRDFRLVSNAYIDNRRN